MSLRLFFCHPSNILIYLLLLTGLLPTTLSAQQNQAANTPQAPPSTFEVASIRPVPADQVGYVSTSPYGLPRFWAKNFSITLLISLAYGMDTKYVIGQPKDLDSTVFDIEAKSQGDVPLDYKHLQPLLQKLLEQRFGLKLHRETRYESGFALVVANHGVKLKKAVKGERTAFITPDQLRGIDVPLTTIASLVSHAVHQPVVDKTGISGNYDVTLTYAPEDSTDSSSPSIYTALKEQLGLELHAEKVPVEMLVIDSVNKMPTEN